MSLFKRCITCCYPSTKPDLHFDEHGECSACRNFKNRPQVDWAARMDEFIKLLESQPAHDGYHCIVPSSGGKDSTYQVLRIIEMGFKPLVVTATTCHLTPVGRRNIDNLARFADTIEITPNRGVRSKLNVLGMELVGDISWPEHAAIFSAPFWASVHHHIPLIVYGECPQREYGSPIGAEAATHMTRRWVGEFAGLLGLRPSDFVGMNGITRDDMRSYMMPEQEFLDVAKTQAVWLGQAEPWDSRRNASVAIANGFKQLTPVDGVTPSPCPASWWTFENLDNAQTGIHDHMMYRKYGYGRLCGQVCVDVRNGVITRDEAMRIVEDRDGLFPASYAGIGVGPMVQHLGKHMHWLQVQMVKHTSWQFFSGPQKDWMHRPILKEFALEAAE